MWLVSLRTVAGMLTVILSYAGWGTSTYRSSWWCPWIRQSGSSRRRIILRGLPFFIGHFKGLLEHKSVRLLLLSPMLNRVTSHASETCLD